MPVGILTDKADSTEHGSESGRSLVLTFSQTTLMCADAHDDTRIMPPNAPDQRPSATDIRFGTETHSRGSVQRSR